MNEKMLRKWLDFAVDTAWQAGRLTLGYFQRPLAVELKGDDSPVTEVDRQAETLIRERINKVFPDHTVLGEEYGETGAAGGLRWIIDPIDGTRSFIHGVPLYATLLALVEDETPLVGVAHFPALNETVYAARGLGCFWNSRPAHVSTVADLRQATVVTSELDSYAKSNRSESWQRLGAATRNQRTWGDAYGYALVATGRAEVAIDPLMAVWDCGPQQVIMEEAGGTFTDWRGRPTIMAGESIATNNLLLDQVLALVD